jgi:hypothetical protein
MYKYSVNLTFESEGKMTAAEVRSMLVTAISCERGIALPVDPVSTIDRDRTKVGKVTVQRL